MKIITPGSVQTTFTPIVTGITGDTLAGVRTANRQPPAYPVQGASRQLSPTAIGADSIFRNSLAQATSQAINAWLPSPANQNLSKKEG